MSNLDFIIETINTFEFDSQFVPEGTGSAADLLDQVDLISQVDLLDQVDSIYQIDSLNEKSYKIDKVTICPEELHLVKYNSLSEFMRSEILQYHLGRFNNHEASSIVLNIPLTCELGLTNSACESCKLIESSNTLDKFTFRVEGSDTTTECLSLKDQWPTHGADLAFKPEEGLKIRQSLGLGLIQDVKIVTNKLLPSIPSPQSSILSKLPMLNDSQLFYTSDSEINLGLLSPSAVNGVVDPSPLASSFISDNLSPIKNSFSVEEYLDKQAHLNKALPDSPTNKPLPATPTNNDGRSRYPAGLYSLRRFEIHSIIEEENVSLLNDNSSTSNLSSTTVTTVGSQNPYIFTPNIEYVSPIFELLTQAEINEIEAINNSSSLHNSISLTRTTTSRSSTLVESSEILLENIRSSSPIESISSRTPLLSDID